MPLLLCTAISSRTLALLLISIKSDQIKWNFNIGWQTATDNITALYRKTTTYDKAERYGQSMWCVYLAASVLQIRHLQLLLLHQHTACEWRRRVQQCSGSWGCGICRRLLTLLTTELQHQHTTPVAISYSSHQQQQQRPFNGLWSGTTRVGRYQKELSPTHTYPHLINFVLFCIVGYGS